MLLLMPGSVRNITALFINPSFVDMLGAFIMHPSEPSRFPEWAAIAPSVTKRVLTTCPPESLFIATVCLWAEHHPYSAHSAQAEGKGTSVPLDFCIIYLVLKILIVAKKTLQSSTILPKAPVSAFRLRCTNLCFQHLNNSALLWNAFIGKVWVYKLTYKAFSRCYKFYGMCY